jgi:hypothetical protein
MATTHEAYSSPATKHAQVNANKPAGLSPSESWVSPASQKQPPVIDRVTKVTASSEP